MNAKQQVSDDSLFGISGGLPNDSYNQVRTPYSATLHIWGTTCSETLHTRVHQSTPEYQVESWDIKCIAEK